MTAAGTQQEDLAVPVLRADAAAGDTPAAAEPTQLAKDSLRVEGYTVERAAVFPSPTNPRTRFPEESLRELADSIRQLGIAQPILVRPIPADFAEKYGTAAQLEIVAGERRWRAAGLAGLDEVPVILRHLSDAEVLAIQITENLQREGITGIEEAEGFERLMKQGLSAAELAKRIGKSKGYVYQRVKLLSLCEEARQALFDGDILDTVAVLLARMPSEQDQRKALGIVRRQDGRDAYSFRNAADYIRRSFALKLDDAPFPIADAKVWKKAGDCQACPKRSGNQPEIYADAPADLCTDAACYHEKKDRWLVQLRKQAEAAGKTVVTGKEAEKLAPHGIDSLAGDLMRTDRTIHGWHISGLPEKLVGKTVAQLMQKAGADIPTRLIEVKSAGKLVEAVELKAVGRALKDAGLLEGRGPSPESSRDKEAKIETEFRRALYDGIREECARGLDERGGRLDLRELRVITRQFWSRVWNEPQKLIARRWIVTDEKLDDGARIARVTALIAELGERELGLLLMDLSFTGMTHCGTWDSRDLPAPLADEAAHRGIAPEQARKAFDERQAEAAKGKKKGKKAAAAATPADEPARCPNTGELPLTAAERAAQDPSAPKIGDRVRATDKALPGSCGKIGIVEALHTGEYTVRFGPDDVAPLMFADEIELAPPLLDGPHAEAA